MIFKLYSKWSFWFALSWGRSLRLVGQVVVLTKRDHGFFPLNIQGTTTLFFCPFFQWTVPLPCLDLVTSAKQDPGFEVSTASGVKSKCSWTATAATENLYQFLQVKIWSEYQWNNGCIANNKRSFPQTLRGMPNTFQSIGFKHTFSLPEIWFDCSKHLKTCEKWVTNNQPF